MQYKFRNWLLYNLLGWILGVVLLIVLSDAASVFQLSSIKWVKGFGMGLGFSFMQSFYLRKIGVEPLKWVVFTTLGFVFPFLLEDVLGFIRVIEKEVNLIYYSMLFLGLLVPIIQWQVIRSKVSLSVWLIRNYIFWVLSLLAIMLVSNRTYLSEYPLLMFIINLVLILLPSVLFSIITWGVLFKPKHSIVKE